MCVAVFVAVACLRLMAGPVDLTVLQDRLSKALDTPRMKVHADRIYAEWSGISQPLRLVLNGLKVTDAAGGTIATAPSIAFTFDARSAVRGQLLPTAIVIDKPTLNGDISREGGMLHRVMAEAGSGSQDEVMDLLIGELLAEHNHESVFGQLDTVQIEHARVAVRDLPSSVVWLAPDVNASLKRDQSGVIILAAGSFDNGHGPVNVGLSGVYTRDRSHISLAARIDGLKPSMLADLSPDAVLLRGVDIELSGRMLLEAGGDGSIRTIDVEVTGGAGILNLPGVLTAAHQVRSVKAVASVDAIGHTARIDRVDVDFGPVKAVVTGFGTRTADGQLFKGRVEVTGIPVDRLGDYWPLEFAAGGRAWALANVSNGTLDVASEFELSSPGDDLEKLKIDRVLGFLNYRDLTVHYMPHMPELLGVSGSARFEGNRLHFDVAAGHAVNLSLADGKIDLTNLDAPPAQQIATLDLPITGKAPDVAAILARRQLKLPKDVLYDPKRLAGDVRIDLGLSFPLLNTLAVNDIDIRADASLAGFSLKRALGDVDLTDATGQVSYADSQLKVGGQGKLDGHAVEIGWRQLFAPHAPFRQRYELKGAVPVALFAKAGFPSPGPYLSGSVGLSIAYQVAGNGASEVTGKADLKAATVSLPPLDWSKAAGTDGKLGFSAKLERGGKLASATFEGHGNGLAGKGSLRFSGDNEVQQLTLKELAIGRTSLAVDWTRIAGGVAFNVKGRAVEISRVRELMREHGEKQREHAAPRTTKVSVQVDQLLSQRGSLGRIAGRLEMRGERLASAELQIGGGKGSALRVTPSGTGRAVGIYIPDLGEFLREAGWLDGMVGGTLDFRGNFNDAAGDGPLVGTLKVGPYRMEKVQARDGVGTLNSTIDSLNRAGTATQQFKGLEAKISKSGDRISVREGRTSGNSLGLTAAGWIDVGSDQARLRGVVVPAFALNNLLSNLPLLGPLLIGGRDSGLFAITYSLEGPLDDLKSNFNMMSAITPGALRDLFSAPVDDGSPPPAPSNEPRFPRKTPLP